MLFELNLKRYVGPDIPHVNLYVRYKDGIDLHQKQEEGRDKYPIEVSASRWEDGVIFSGLMGVRHVEKIASDPDIVKITGKTQLKEIHEMTKFLDPIFEKFPGLQKEELVNISDKSVFSTLDDYLKIEHLSFDKVKRPDLYRLSMLIEQHAARAYEPLVATFETEHLYKYVEERYLKLIRDIPKTWIIGGFDNPFFAPRTPQRKLKY